MSILKASILFSKASNMYSQLRYINSQENIEKYQELLKELDHLYGRDNTRLYRDELQDFIDKYSQNIYAQSLTYSEDNFWLD